MGLFGLTAKEKALWAQVKPEVPLRLCMPGTFEAYQSKVEKTGDGYFYITVPKSNNAFLEIEPGTKLELELEIYNKGISKIRFSSIILDYNWAEGEMIKLKMPKGLKIQESRRYYRIKVSVQAEFSFIEEKKDRNLEIKAPYFTGTIKSLSEGGAMIEVEKLMSIEKGSLMNIHVLLPGGYPVRTRAQVKHIYPVQGRFGIGVQFMFMNSMDRGDLRKFISLKRKRTADF